MLMQGGSCGPECKAMLLYKRFLLSCSVLFLIGWSGALGVAQSQKQPAPKPADADDDPIKLETTLVQVPVIVSDRGGRYVTDLNGTDFAIFEDGVRQKLEFFGSVDEPFTVALCLDSSGSTKEQLDQIKAAALAFVNNLRGRDRVMVISFNDSVEIECDFTSDHEVLRRAINHVRAGEYTQVYEAIYTAVWEKFENVSGRKSVIVFTDGIDTASSEINQDDTLNAIVESEDIIVYPIRYATRADVERKLDRRGALLENVSGSGDPEREKLERSRLELDRVYRKADDYLQELARLSGGVLERADRLVDLEAAFGRIAEELRHQYLLGYYPSNKNRADNERRIDVRVNRADLRVRARPGYRAARQ